MAIQYAHKPIVAAPQEHTVLAQLERATRASYLQQHLIPRLIGPDGQQIELPESVFDLFRELVHDLAQGRAVMIVSRNQMLTTQQAADLLNVSRPYLIKLLEEGEIPFTRVGTHRRIRFEDLMTYKQHRDTERRTGLTQLTQMAEEMGDYD